MPTARNAELLSEERYGRVGVFPSPSRDWLPRRAYSPLPCAIGRCLELALPRSLAARQAWVSHGAVCGQPGVYMCCG
eukprot:973445-Prorocentrum_minimum.AAC.1